MEKSFDSLSPVRTRQATLFGGRFNPSMMITAREARGLTQSDLATAMEVSQPLIGKWEADLSAPNDEQMASLASALGVQPELFFVDRPRRLASMSDFYHRSLTRARRADVKAIHARCSIVDLQLDRLLSIADDPKVDLIPDIDPEKHTGDIERIAAMTRVAMNIDAGPLKNLVDAIEQCGGIVIDRKMEVDDVDALCRWVPELPKLFFVNGAKPADRTRFSLAHELGHTVMHFGRDFDLALAEKQANAFASAFLMPAKDIRRDLKPDLNLTDLATMKRKWRVSMQAIAMRARDLKAIDKRRFDAIYMQISRNGWRKMEPILIEGESPRIFNQLIKQHIDAGYTRSELAKMLFVMESDIVEMLADATSPTWAAEGVRMRLAR